MRKTDSPLKSIKNLFIFNLEMDLDSHVLAAAHDWVESFANQFEHVYVYSTHVRRVLLPINVSIVELGGGSFPKRVMALLKLAKSLIFILRRRGESAVFHHMSTYSAALIGLPLRIFRVNQVLWYSHSKASISFRFASVLVNKIVSSSPEALPSSHHKMKSVGHGIKSDRFMLNLDDSLDRKGIVSLGRYARVKNYEEFILLSHKYPQIEMAIFGPDGEQNYKRELSSQVDSNYSRMNLLGPLSYSEIPRKLHEYEFFYSGTPKSVDKAAIEAALSGCLILSSNSNTLKVTGMLDVWKMIGAECPPNIEDQFGILSNHRSTYPTFRRELVAAAFKTNDLQSLVRTVTKELKDNGGPNCE